MDFKSYEYARFEKQNLFRRSCPTVFAICKIYFFSTVIINCCINGAVDIARGVKNDRFSNVLLLCSTTTSPKLCKYLHRWIAVPRVMPRKYTPQMA